MIKYANGKIDTRKVVSVYATNADYYDINAIVYDGQDFDEVSLYHCYSWGVCESIYSKNNLDDIEEVEIDGNEELLRLYASEKVRQCPPVINMQKGDMVEVFKGRKYPKGMKFKVLKVIYQSYGYSGIQTEYLLGLVDGQWVKVDANNCKLENEETIKANLDEKAIEKLMDSFQNLFYDDRYLESSEEKAIIKKIKY